MNDVPIQELNYIRPQVIDFGDIRVARGMSRRPVTTCLHAQLRYDLAERRIWCQDCEATVEGFDAFMVLVRNFEAMVNRASQNLRDAEEARAAVVHRIAARAVEKTWRRGMAVTCPHCHRGILPGDSLGGHSIEFEKARRAKDEKKGLA